jgi:hypothetical protein
MLQTSAAFAHAPAFAPHATTLAANSRPRAGQKKGGQALLGGLDICVSRNFFGAQINSFETQLPAHSALQQYGPDGKFRAVFIRAPAVIDAGPQVRAMSFFFFYTPRRPTSSPHTHRIIAIRRRQLTVTESAGRHVDGSSACGAAVSAKLIEGCCMSLVPPAAG